MKVLWRLFKVVIALALVIPVSIFLLATALGIFGALLGLAIVLFKFAVLGLIGYGVLRLVAHLMAGPSGTKPTEQLPPVDPHYEAAMRELDRELGEAH